MGIIAAMARRRNFPVEPPVPLRELPRITWDALPALLMPVILLGGIYSGYFSAIEAAAVSLVYALAVETFIHREMKLRDFYDVVLDASKLGGTLFPLLAVALSLNLVLTEHRVPLMMVEVMKG